LTIYLFVTFQICVCDSPSAISYDPYACISSASYPPTGNIVQGKSVPYKLVSKNYQLS